MADARIHRIPTHALGVRMRERLRHFRHPVRINFLSTTSIARGEICVEER